MVSKLVLFRFVLVKYAHGFATNFGMFKNNGAIYLYFLCVFVSTLYTFLVHFFPLVSTIYNQDTDNLCSFFIGLDDYNSSNYLKMIVAQIPFMTFIVILYINIQIFKTKSRIKRKHYQFNIITFCQNFYFYILFYMSNVFFILIRINISKFFSVEKAELILVYVYLFYLSIDWFVRPIVIILLLRKDMPDFFDDLEISKDNTTFTVNVKNIFPREQEFLTYKPFTQNARWGSSKKFNVCHEKIVMQMPEITL